MAYPSDSTIAAPQVGDQSGQGSSYAAFHDQVYALPGAATGNESTMYANQSFAPDQSTGGVLPPFEGVPADAVGALPGQELPVDAVAVQPGDTLPSDVTPAQTGINPWDTYVMDSSAIAGQPDATQLEGGSPEGVLPEGASPEAQIAQLQQHLQDSIEEVVQLGTSGQMTGTQEELEQFTAALTEVVQTAEILGALTAPAGDAMPTDGSAMPADGSAMPTDGSAMPADGSAMPTDGSAMPADGSAMPADGSAMPTDGSAMPTDGSAMPTQPALEYPAGEQLQENPYELQGDVAPPDGFNTQQAFQPTGSPEIDMLQAKLGSQVEQLMSFIAAPGADPASPASSSQTGNADNFKMALKNIVQTAQELGAKSQLAQGTQPDSVG